MPLSGLGALLFEVVDPSLDPVEKLLVTVFHPRKSLDDQPEPVARDRGDDDFERDLAFVEADSRIALTK